MTPRAAVSLLLIGLVFAAYGNSLSNGFVFDDLPLISHNRTLSGLHQLWASFVQDYWAGSQDSHEGAVSPRSGLYRPLVTGSYTLNGSIAGVQPFGFHLVNVALHALVTFLLYLVALQWGLRQTAAAVAAGLFAVHPIHTEAVTSVVGRAELMMSAGALAFVWLASEGRRWLACPAFAFALLSKEQALVLPIVLLISEWSRYTTSHSRRMGGLSGRFTWQIWRPYAAYGLVALAYFALRGIALGGFALPPVDSLVNPAALAGTWIRVCTAIKVAGMYLWLMLWPARLSANYSFDSITLADSMLDVGVFSSLLVWGALLLLIVWGFARKIPPLVFCGSLTLFTFLPVSNVLLPIGTIMGERLFYLPSAGLCLLAGLAFERSLTFILSPARRTVLVILLLVMGIALIVRTAIRNQDWADNEHIASSILRVAPNNAMAHALLGYARKAHRTPESQAQALQSYETALHIYPDYVRLDPVFASHYGELLIDAGRPLEAIRTFEDALSTHRRWSTMHYNLGLAYAKVSRLSEAEKELRLAQTLNPTDADTYNVLSHVLLAKGRYAESLDAAEEALKYAPHHEGAQYYRAAARQQLGLQESGGPVHPSP